MEPRAKEWMLAIARGDYHAMSRLLRDEPRLSRRKVSQLFGSLCFRTVEGVDDVGASTVKCVGCRQRGLERWLPSRLSRVVIISAAWWRAEPRVDPGKPRATSLNAPQSPVKPGQTRPTPANFDQSR